jgi:hypothetical protein
LKYRFTLAFVVVLAFVAVFAFLVTRFARSASATYDENTHLPSGCTYLRWDDFRLNPEHPPLIKEWAALFALSQDPWPPDIAGTDQELASRPNSDSLIAIKRSWATALDNILSQWIFGHYFLYGPTSATIQRFGAPNPIQIPTAVPLDQTNFLNNADNLLFRGRMAIMLLGVLLAVLIFLWARELWGFSGGVLAIALYSFDPNFIANSGLVTTDVGETAFIFGAVYFLWRTCRRLTISNVIATMLFFGMAFASKLTSILLVPIFALLMLGRVFSTEEWPVAARGRHELAAPFAKLLPVAGLFAALAVTTYTIIWAVYGFRYSAAKDPAQAAKAESWVLPPSDSSIAGQATHWREPGYFPIEYVVRRTAAMRSILMVKPDGAPESEIEALLASTPLGLTGSLILFAQRTRLLPEAYLYGFAYARMESLTRGSFLRGSFSNHGFWDYFLWSFLLKTPLVTLAAIAAGLVFAIRRRDPWCSRLSFLLVPVIVYWGVSMRSSLNIGHRHLLPIYPFLFVLAGGLAWEWAKLPARLKPHVAWLSLAAIAASGSVVFSPPWNPVLVYPHYLAYFNELAGGPPRGGESLVDSNLDWGQDLKGLKSWLDERHISKPIYLCYFGMADPRYYGIPYINVPRILGTPPMQPTPYDALESKGLYGQAINQFSRDLRPGDYIAISATNQVGVYASPAVRAVWRRILDHSVLVDQIGYSIFIYKVGPSV